jgi:hypothetical protein
LFSAVSLVGVDKAQAAELTYTINGSNLSFLKVNNSSLTGIGHESIAVSEGRFYGPTLGDWWALLPGAKEYYDLAGARVGFYQGEFRGLQTGGSDQVIIELGDGSEEIKQQLNYRISWFIFPYPTGPSTWVSTISGHSELIYYSYQPTERWSFNDKVFYTLVDPAPEPVPEPLTAGGTALALAGLSWLKHKKKMAA